MSDEPEQDPNVCPRCGEPYNNADPASHVCPEADPPEIFQPDE